jgi:DNA-binding NarL/FixJ family response regulator
MVFLALSTSGEPAPVEPRRARVLAVDDHDSFLDVIRKVVGAAPELELLGEANTGEGAIDSACNLHPDLVLMDVAMPGIGGIAAAKEIKARTPSTVVVLLSATHPDDLPREARECFVDEIVWKPQLRPGMLVEIWRTHTRRPSADG